MPNDTVITDCAIIIGRGSWKPEGGGGIGENLDEREGLNVKFYLFGGGALLFSFLFINWEKGRRAIRV